MNDELKQIFSFHFGHVKNADLFLRQKILLHGQATLHISIETGCNILHHSCINFAPHFKPHLTLPPLRSPRNEVSIQGFKQTILQAQCLMNCSLPNVSFTTQQQSPVHNSFHSASSRHRRAKAF